MPTVEEYTRWLSLWGLCVDMGNDTVHQVDCYEWKEVPGPVGGYVEKCKDAATSTWALLIAATACAVVATFTKFINHRSVRRTDYNQKCGNLLVQLLAIGLIGATLYEWVAECEVPISDAETCEYNGYSDSDDCWSTANEMNQYVGFDCAFTAGAIYLVACMIELIIPAIARPPPGSEPEEDEDDKKGTKGKKGKEKSNAYANVKKRQANAKGNAFKDAYAQPNAYSIA